MNTVDRLRTAIRLALVTVAATATIAAATASAGHVADAASKKPRDQVTFVAKQYP